MSKIPEFLRRDGAGWPIQVGGDSAITDGHGTPVTSPQAVATAATTPLTIPQGAVQLHIGGDEAMYYAPDASASADHGVLIPANAERTFNVRAGSIVSVIAATAGNVSYHFTILDGDND